MSRVCEVCGKGKMDGKTVSHANNKAPRKYNVNLGSFTDLTVVNSDTNLWARWVK